MTEFEEMLFAKIDKLDIKVDKIDKRLTKVEARWGVITTIAGAVILLIAKMQDIIAWIRG